MHQHPDKTPRTRVIAVVLGCGALFLYSHLALLAPDIVISPDENANFIAAERIARTGLPALPVDVAAAPLPLVHPRSMVNIGTKTVPESFLGFPLLAGGLARVVGVWIIPFVTPFLAALGVVAFFFLLLRPFGRGLALVGAIALMVHPAYWYNAERGLFHNVSFVAFLLFAALAGDWAMRSRRFFAPAIFGLLLGIALTIRTSEIVWVAPVLAALVLVLRRAVLHLRWIGALIGVLVAFVPILFVNVALYGAPLRFGYLPQGLDTVTQLAQERGSTLLGILFPFGWRPGRSALLFSNYLVRFVPWYTVPTVLGIFALLLRVVRTPMQRLRRAAPVACFTLVCIAAGAWLIFAYGSWEIAENSAGQDFFLGSSYLRYWLPLVAALVPCLLVGIRVLLRSIPARWQNPASGALALLFLALGLQMVYRAPAYGLLELTDTLAQGRALRDAVQQRVPADAVILAGTADKWLYPAYRVIPAILLTDPAQADALWQLVQERPVYLLVNSAEHRDPPILEHLAEARLIASGKRLLSPLHTLYRVQPSPLLGNEGSAR